MTDLLALVRRLRNYARHTPDCWNASDSLDLPCRCGLQQALDELAKAEKEHAK